jgi:DNA-binding NarL/FixJ family response regulator
MDLVPMADGHHCAREGLESIPRTGPEVADDSAARGGKLCAREEQVLRLLALGYSNKGIAGRLGLSVKTVETYKARALEKLGLRTRVDIVRFAAARGWLADDPTEPSVAAGAKPAGS